MTGDAMRECKKLRVDSIPSVEGNKKTSATGRNPSTIFFNEEANLEITLGPNTLMNI
jgi:hypothetical protein